MKLAGQLGIVALIALVLTAAPGGGNAINVVLIVLSLAFFTALAFVAYRAYFQFRFELSSLSERMRAVMWGSLGLAFLTLCGTSRLFAGGGLGVLAWFALLGICGYGLYWTFSQYRAYG